MKDHQISIWEFKALSIPAPFEELVAATYCNGEIQEAFAKHYNKFAYGEYKKIVVSVSGGADSDRLIDFIERIGYPEGTLQYVFFNTGMEYNATRQHLNDLEEKYGIKINRANAKMPVAIACKKYGVPFLSKQISNYIHRLQHNGFKWEDKPFEELYKEYPKCKAALRWWCNEWGEGKRTNISRRKWLKEFLIAYPPDFDISDMCCQKSKKDTAHKYQATVEADLSVQGLRKAEGGARSTAIQSCFTQTFCGCDTLRPLFWFKKKDCEEYDELFGIVHSCCYTKYGLSRTGCACCPFGQFFEKELEAARQYEPGLYKLANMVFSKSYEYTRKYKEFAQMMDEANVTTEN